MIFLLSDNISYMHLNLHYYIYIIHNILFTYYAFTVVVVVAFFVCWAPFQAQRLVAIYGDADHEDYSSTSIIDANMYQALNYVSGILYYLSATINPLLYNLMSHKYRTAFKVSRNHNIHFNKYNPKWL